MRIEVLSEVYLREVKADLMLGQILGPMSVAAAISDLPRVFSRLSLQRTDHDSERLRGRERPFRP